MRKVYIQVTMLSAVEPLYLDFFRGCISEIYSGLQVTCQLRFGFSKAHSQMGTPANLQCTGRCGHLGMGLGKFQILTDKRLAIQEPIEHNAFLVIGHVHQEKYMPLYLK